MAVQQSQNILKTYCYQCKKQTKVRVNGKYEFCSHYSCQTLLIIGDYRIVGLLGDGGCGTVFEAKHKYLSKRTAAIKLLKSEKVIGKLMIKRFLREANIMLDLDHHNIVKLYEFSMLPNGRYFLVMEKLEGESLQERIASSPRFSIAELKWLIEQTCDGLHYVHEREVVHCDLKPGNIFLSGEKGCPISVKLIDFGIASLQLNVTLATNSESPIGTPVYMSPEQLKGSRGNLDKRSDLFTLGVILYRLLTNHIPYPSRDFSSLALHIIRKAPLSLSHSVPQKPWAVELEQFMRRAMAKKVEERPQTALQFWQECEVALSAQENIEGNSQSLQVPFRPVLNNDLTIHTPYFEKEEQGGSLARGNSDVFLEAEPPKLQEEPPKLQEKPVELLPSIESFDKTIDISAFYKDQNPLEMSASDKTLIAEDVWVQTVDDTPRFSLKFIGKVSLALILSALGIGFGVSVAYLFTRHSEPIVSPKDKTLIVKAQSVAFIEKKEPQSKKVKLPVEKRSISFPQERSDSSPQQTKQKFILIRSNPSGAFLYKGRKGYKGLKFGVTPYKFLCSQNESTYTFRVFFQGYQVRLEKLSFPCALSERLIILNILKKRRRVVRRRPKENGMKKFRKIGRKMVEGLR